MITLSIICLLLLNFLPIVASFYFKFNKVDHAIIWVSCALAAYVFYGILLIPLVMVIFKEVFSSTYHKKS